MCDFSLMFQCFFSHIRWNQNHKGRIYWEKNHFTTRTNDIFVNFSSVSEVFLRMFHIPFS